MRGWRRWRRRSAERRLEAELQDHLDRHAHDLAARGAGTDEAIRQARRAFGGVEQIKDRCRDQRRGRVLSDIRRDLTFAWRLYRRTPVFSLVIVVSLGLGIGVNAALFGLADALLLRPLPVPEPERLLQVDRVGPGGAGPVMAYPTYRALAEATVGTMDVLATSRVWRWNVRVGAAADERVAGELVSRNYFETLGVAARPGRVLSAGGGDPLAPEVVLSHGYWTRRFNRDPRVLGRALTINNTPVSVVGVAEAAFTGLEIGDPVDMWVPLELQPRLLNGPNWLDQAGNNWLRVIGRLAPGASAGSARERAHAAFRHAIAARGLRNDERIVVADGRHGLSTLGDRLGRPMRLLAVLVGIVLLTACVNVATLHLGRASHRQRELAVRLALGGGRARLVRQLLTENLLLSGAGALLGLFLAWATSDVLLGLLFPALDRAPLQVGVDARLLLFTTAIAGGAGLISGLLPARLAWRVDVQDGLRSQGTRSVGGASARTALLLPVLQVALTFALLVGAALFTRSLQALHAVDPGFDRAHVLAVRLNAQALSHAQPELARLYRQLLSETAALPGVRRAALADQALFTHAVRQRTVTVDGVGRRADDLNPYVMNVSPGFFETMAIGIVAGREFGEGDLAARAAPVAVVNRRFARTHFGEAGAVGRRFGFGGDGAPRDVTIVGVVEDAKYADLRETAPLLVYSPLGPANFPTRSFSFSETTLTLRSAGDPDALAAAVRRTVARVDPSLPIVGIATLQAHVDASLARDRLISTLSMLFAGLALLLTCTGLYGVLSYGVSRQMREIGVRLALGAQPAQVRRSIVQRGLLVLVLGLAAGLPLAWATAHLVRAMLFEVSPTDPWAFAGAALAVAATALLVSYGPARRAGGIDPLAALRRD